MEGWLVGLLMIEWDAMRWLVRVWTCDSKVTVSHATREAE